MIDETKAARLEGIRAKLSEGQYYGLAISDITWLGEQLEAAWDNENRILRWVDKLRARVSKLEREKWHGPGE